MELFVFLLKVRYVSKQARRSCKEQKVWDAVNKMLIKIHKDETQRITPFPLAGVPFIRSCLFLYLHNNSYHILTLGSSSIVLLSFALNPATCILQYWGIRESMLRLHSVQWVEPSHSVTIHLYILLSSDKVCCKSLRLYSLL